jgi:hypothetical protein
MLHVLSKAPAGACGIDSGTGLKQGATEKKRKKTANVRTYFIWPGLSFCTRAMA